MLSFKGEETKRLENKQCPGNEVTELQPVKHISSIFEKLWLNLYKSFLASFSVGRFFPMRHIDVLFVNLFTKA